MDIPDGHPPFEDPYEFAVPPHERARVPEHLYQAIQDYFNRRVAPVEYLQRLLEGKKEVAEGLAPAEDRLFLAPLLELCYSYGNPYAIGSEAAVEAWLDDPTGGCLPVGDLSKAAVLAALYNAAVPQGMGLNSYSETPATEEDGAALIREQDQPHPTLGELPLYFDYVNGRRLKIDLTGAWLSPERYDETNGTGAAARTIEILRRTGRPDAPEILQDHHLGLIVEGAKHDILVDTPNDDPELTSLGKALLKSLKASKNLIE